MVSLLYKLLKECCRAGFHFMSVLKIEHMSPSTHNKVIMIRLQYMAEPEILSLVLILCFVCNQYPECIAVMMTI